MLHRATAWVLVLEHLRLYVALPEGHPSVIVVSLKHHPLVDGIGRNHRLPCGVVIMSDIAEGARLTAHGHEHICPGILLRLEGHSTAVQRRAATVNQQLVLPFSPIEKRDCVAHNFCSYVLMSEKVNLFFCLKLCDVKRAVALEGDAACCQSADGCR